MRFIAFIFFYLFTATMTHASELDIKTIDKEGQTVFYIQAGAFSQQQNAIQRKKELESQVEQTVDIIFDKEKKLYLVQIGPIKDYISTRELKTRLTNNPTQLLDKSVPIKLELPQAAEPVLNPLVNTEKIIVQPPVRIKSFRNELPATHKIILADAKPKHNDEQLWNLNNVDIRAVIAEVSRVTGKNFIIDPRVQGKISIVSSKPMSNKELYQVFLSMLQVSGFAAIPNKDAIKIIPNIDAKTQASDLLSQLRSPAMGDEMVVEVIPVKNVPSEQLVPVLRPLMPQWSHVSAYVPSNMLILSGRANNIKRLAKIISQVDNSSANDIDIIHLRYAMAMDIANTLKDILKSQQGPNHRNPTMLAPDDRSNSLLLSGTKTERIRLRLLISKLDRQGRESNSGNTQVVYLNYLRAEDLVPILAGIAQANFSGTVGTTIGTITRPVLDSTNPASSIATGTSSSGQAPLNSATTAAATADTTGSATQSEGSTKPTVQIIAEPNTNSIILNAPVNLIRILKKVITQLDIRPAQLLIEALVAEIDENDITELGIEWGSNQQTGDPHAFRPGFAIINSHTDIDDFQAQIYALARKRRANILSTPSVVVLDNRQAKILVGKQVSVASTSYPGNSLGAGVANPYTTFDRVNVALHLYVRPQITRGQGIQLQIDQGNDTLDQSTVNSPNEQPVFKISSIVTSVHVDNGDIVVLGGLNQDGLANADNRLPILGDIPGIGKLFQRNIHSREKKVLMVFIKTSILRSQNDAIQVTGGKYNALRDNQLGFLRTQDYDPRNEASVLPPLKEAKLPKPFCHSVKLKATTKTFTPVHKPSMMTK